MSKTEHWLAESRLETGNQFVGPRKHIKSANDLHTKGWNDAIERVCEDHDMLDYDDLCRLSRAFNESANLATAQDYRINEALKRRIAAARL